MSYLRHVHTFNEQKQYFKVADQELVEGLTIKVRPSRKPYVLPSLRCDIKVNATDRSWKLHRISQYKFH